MAVVTTFSIPESIAPMAIPGYDLHTGDVAWIRGAARDILKAAILQGVEPAPASEADTSSPTVKINVSLPEPAGGIAVAKARELGLTVGPYCKRLMMALAARDAQPSTSVADTPPPGVLGEVLVAMRQAGMAVQYRAEQTEHYEQINNALSDGAIGLCEAGTGTGKTMAILAAAANVALEHGKRVVVATPTVALIRQFASTHSVMAKHGTVPPLRVVLGRREFVSPSEVMAVVNAGVGDFDPDTVSNWIKAGGPAPAASGLGIRWLASSLVLIEPKFPIAEAVLPEVVAMDDPGLEAYMSQFGRRRDIQGEIMLCTHAMLAYDIRSRTRIANTNDEYKAIEAQISATIKTLKKVSPLTEDEQEHAPKTQPLTSSERENAKIKLQQLGAERGKLLADISDESGLLPAYQYALIDEAHQLEPNFSNALSDYVAMQVMLRLAREFRSLGGKMTASELNVLVDAVSNLQEAAGQIEEQMLPLNSRSKAIPIIRANLLSAAEILQALPTPKTEKNRDLVAAHVRLKRMGQVIRTAASEAQSGQAYLRFSPVRAFPQLFVGRSTVQNVLQRMWESVAGGAAISATLYLRKGQGYSAGYQRTLLGIPENRAREFKPVFPEFLLQPVVGLWSPALRPEGNPWLRPPTRADKLSEADRNAAEANWIAELAPVVNYVTGTAKGGTLILMTSYASAKALAGAIETSPYLVLANPDSGLAAQAERFLRLSHAGHRPIWIAVGGAWTGLDVGGHDPYARLFGTSLAAADDNVVTDLIVPRIPFGANQTITHAYRLRTNPGVPWEMLDAAFRLKQGLGRPIRRPGLPANRRFWVLDGRLNDKRLEAYINGIRGILGIYRQQTLTPAEINGDTGAANGAPSGTGIS